ncbi:MAG: DUF2079 domain-containing protein, partial [Candidatus Harrisonbacteria bacterium]|nr:DUF2079 domain-containing protein [Candidatus Harrisonbacteria bacterium]
MDSNLHIYWARYRALIIAVLLYVIVFDLVVSFRHHNFQTQTWDMGVFTQLFWNTVHGRIMQGSIEELPNHFGIHWSPGLLLLAPGYALFPSPYYLLIVQTLALAAGALPVYALALRALGRKPAFLAAFAYLAYPSLHWLNLFDFHEIAFFVPTLLAALYFADAARWGWAAFWFTLAASMKEDAIIGIAFAGLYFLIRKKDGAATWWSRERLYAALTVLGASLYFILAVKVFMPAFGGGLLRLDRYAELGGSASEIIGNLARNPALFFATIGTLPKLSYVIWLFAPLAFLPLFSGWALLLLVPGLLENLLTTNQFQFSTFYQYDAVLIPGMLYCAVYGLRNVTYRWPMRARFARNALVAGIIVGFFVRSPINPFTFPFELFGASARTEAFREMSRGIPAGVSVAAQTNILPHLANRERIAMLGNERGSADVVLIDASDAFGFSDDEKFRAYIDNYANSGRYRISTMGDRYVAL